MDKTGNIFFNFEDVEIRTLGVSKLRLQMEVVNRIYSRICRVTRTFMMTGWRVAAAQSRSKMKMPKRVAGINR